MLHSSGLGRKAIMLPHQTRNVFLSWLLLHYITLGILAGNLCPPESLESVSLYPGMLNTFCLLMWIRLNCVQSSWLLECKGYCLHVFLCLAGSMCRRTYTQLSTLHHCLREYPYVFMFTSPCYCEMYSFYVSVCVFACVCEHTWVYSRYLTKARCLLYYEHYCVNTKGFKVSFNDTEGLWVATSKRNTFLSPPILMRNRTHQPWLNLPSVCVCFFLVCMCVRASVCVCVCGCVCVCVRATEVEWGGSRDWETEISGDSRLMCVWPPEWL